MNVLNFFDLQRFDEEITINYTVVDDDGNETSSTITVTSTTLIPRKSIFEKVIK